MDATKSTPWIVGAGFASVAILALGWMFAISPMMASAADARSQAVQERTSNDALTVQLTKLADQFAHLDTYKADLAALRLQIPEQVDPAGLNSELAGLAQTAGVTLTVLSVGAAVPFAPAAAVAAPAVAAAPAAAATPATASAKPGVAAPAATAAFYTVPVSLDLLGTYDQVTAFLSSFQTTSQRLFLATGVNAVSQKATGATGGRPALADGDLDLTVTGFAYVMPTAAAAPAPAGTTAPKLPEPSGQKNPFQPVA